MTVALAPGELDNYPGNARVFGTEGRSDFGEVGGYSPCGCCGGFHAIYEDGGDGPLAFLNADDRGGLGSNGKISLTPGGAALTLTRSNLGWGASVGQAANVTFAFRSTAPTAMPDDTTGFTRFTDLQIAATLLALAAWSEVANITFTRVNDGDGYSNGAVMLFGNYASGSEGAAAFAYMPRNTSLTSTSGDVWINASLSYNATPVVLGYGQQVLTHEVGHAIGLSHPAGYNAGAGQSLSYAANAGYYEDSRQYTIMSYFNESNTGGSFGAGRYSAAPLMDDIAAAQRLYGANMATRTGDNTYGFNSNAGQTWFSATSASSSLIFAVWDAGGTDTFDFSGYGNNQIIDLRQGSFSNVGALIGNVSIALGVVIENATGGSGADTIYGNPANNVLRGGAGNDRIDGGLGSDTVVFSGARSQYTITWNGQIGTVTGPDGTDTISNVEFLSFADQTIAAAPTGGLNVSGDITANTMTGGALGDRLSGLGGNDTISGLGGNDVLDGGTGDDVLNGGDGDDVLIGGFGNDTLAGGAGFDQANYASAASGVTVNLATGLTTGGAGNDTLTSIEWVIGSAFADTLIGSAGSDVLDGGGGNDTIRGGSGDDVIIAGAGAQTGGAPDVVKGRGTANASTGTAVSLDGAFDLLTRTDVANPTTIPHATVVATTHGGLEYYAFTVAAGQSITLDIDNGSFDTTLRLIGPGGTELATNDDATPDGGPSTDSQLTFTATTAGVYYAVVGLYDQPNEKAFPSLPPAAGGTYTLHVSVTNHAVAPLTLSGSTLYGENGNDTITGGSADDLLVGGAGSDILNGGAGVDTAAYSGTIRGYSTVSATRVAGGAEGGVDTLSDIEVLRFLDGRVSYNVNDLTTHVYRLYDAAFDRAPDVFGLADFTAAFASGAYTLDQVFATFEASAEFRARYGALDNDAFVRSMYRFSLNREGDAAGVALYVNALNSGTSRATILQIFSESLEHKQIINDFVRTNGLWVQDEKTIAIARLYDTIVDRVPDLAGLKSFRAALDEGYTLANIAAVMIGSPEFTQRYGALNNQQFVEQLYRSVLDREGDPAGIASFVAALGNGYSRTDLAVAFSESPEHRFAYQATYDTVVRNLEVGAYPAAGALESIAIKEDGAWIMPPETLPTGHDDAGAAASDLWGADAFLTIDHLDAVSDDPSTTPPVEPFHPAISPVDPVHGPERVGVADWIDTDLHSLSVRLVRSGAEMDHFLA
jgi:Ca2+-binding RTX toxin-like protein